MTAARREKLDIVLELDSPTDLHVLDTVISTGNFHAFFVDGQLIGVDELRRKVQAQSKWNQVLEADGAGVPFWSRQGVWPVFPADSGIST